MRVSAQNGAKELCVFEQWIAPGFGAPTHTHDVEEVLTVLAGEAEVWVDDERAILNSGEYVIVPAHSPHGFRNTGQEELRVQAILAAPFFDVTFGDRTQRVRRWEQKG